MKPQLKMSAVEDVISAFVLILLIASTRAAENDPNEVADIQSSSNGSGLDFQKENQSLMSKLLMNPDALNVIAALQELQEQLNDTECGRDVLKLVAGVQAKEVWAISNVDAIGKPRSGIMYGETEWGGSYDQCRNITWGHAAPYDTNFCWLNLNFSEDIRVSLTRDSQKVTLPPEVYFPPTRIGLCVPQRCSGEELKSIVDYLYDIIPDEDKQIFEIRNVTCLEQGNNLSLLNDWKAVAVIVLCCIFLFWVVVGTAYDVLFYQPFLLFDSKKRGFSQVPLFATEDDDDSDSDALSFDNEKLLLEPEIGTCGQTLLAFSCYVNLGKILTLKYGKPALAPIHGLRVVSMIWILSALTYITILQKIDNNVFGAINFLNNIMGMFIINIQYAFDTILTISGCLMAYNFLITYDRKPKKGISWISLYIGQYIRMMLPYIMFLLVFRMSLGKYFGDGPYWKQDGLDGDLCERYWWKNLFFIQNFWSYGETCMHYGWYLALEMQFFLIAPLLLIFLPAMPAVSVIMGGIVIVMSSVTSGLLAHQYNLQTPNRGDSFIGSDAFVFMYDHFHTKPWIRVGPYIIGLGTGWLLYRTNNSRLQMKKILVILGWNIASICMFNLMLMAHHSTFSVIISSVHQATARIIWSLSISWIIFVCCTGNGGIINSILSWPAFMPLSRLSYCAYVVHTTLVQLSQDSLSVRVHAVNIYLTDQVIGMVLVTYFVALILSTVCESPVIAFQKLLGKRKKIG